MTLILQLIATAQLFTEPLLFTGGGPANATLTVLLLIYRYAFQNSLGGEYGMAAALSLMLAAFLAVFTAGYYWLTRSLEHELMTARRRGAATRGRRATRRERPRRSFGARTGASAGRAGRCASLHGRDASSSCSSSGLGPILWMLKSSVTPTQDTLRDADGAVAARLRPRHSSATAWSRTHIDRYLLNTVVIAFGSWVAQIVVATTAGFALSVLRPRVAAC